MVDGQDRIARVLRHGMIGGLELICLAGAGGAAALLMWAIVEPVSFSPAETVSADMARPSLSAFAVANDPFLRGAAMPGLTQSTDAGIQLFATRAGFEGGGSAIMSIGGQPQAAYLVGDMLAEGMRLVSVGVDSVQVERNGERTRIAFAATPGAGFTAPPALATSGPLDALGLRPATRDGQTIGYELVQRGQISALGDGALKPGDILISVNGRTISPESLDEQRATLMSGGSVEVSLERDGAVQTVRLGETTP